MRSWFKSARNAKFLTQGDVAQALRVSLACVQNWEHGRTRPFARHQKALSDLLGIDVRSHLLSESERGVA